MCYYLTLLIVSKKEDPKPNGYISEDVISLTFLIPQLLQNLMDWYDNLTLQMIKN